MPQPMPNTLPTTHDEAARLAAIKILWQLRGEPGERRDPYLYFLIDCARDERIYPKLRELQSTTQIMPLYQGEALRDLAAVAPYIVEVGDDDRIFNWLWHEGWGESWGIWFWSLVSMPTLVDHFRRLTMVRTEDGQHLLFRFYDSRVLPTFLPTCNAQQLRQMFGPVERYLVEVETEAAVATVEFSLETAGGKDNVKLFERLRRLLE